MALIDPLLRKPATPIKVPKVLFVDFDGALHPSTEVADYASTGLPLAAYIQSRPQLLRWAPQLAEALAGTPCEIVIHSSWRNQLRDSELLALLEPSGLADRFIGSASRGGSREQAVLGVMRVMSLEPEDVLILDDAVGEFDVLAPRLVACNPLLGMSDSATANLLRARLLGIEPGDLD